MLKGYSQTNTSWYLSKSLAAFISSVRLVLPIQPCCQTIHILTTCEQYVLHSEMKTHSVQSIRYCFGWNLRQSQMNLPCQLLHLFSISIMVEILLHKCLNGEKLALGLWLEFGLAFWQGCNFLPLYDFCSI